MQGTLCDRWELSYTDGLWNLIASALATACIDKMDSVQIDQNSSSPESGEPAMDTNVGYFTIIR